MNRLAKTSMVRVLYCFLIAILLPTRASVPKLSLPIQDLYCCWYVRCTIVKLTVDVMNSC